MCLFEQTKEKTHRPVLPRPVFSEVPGFGRRVIVAVAVVVFGAVVSGALPRIVTAGDRGHVALAECGRYIGLEFSDVYTALGSEVTFIEAMPRIMFFFDKQIAQLAERLLIRPRNIDYRTGVFASKVGHAYLAVFNSRAACHMPSATCHQPRFACFGR